MQIEYPENVHLIRGNHEAADINALFGFRLECIERMVNPSLQKYSSCLSLAFLRRLSLLCTFARERMMASGRGQDLINFLIIFLLLH